MAGCQEWNIKKAEQTAMLVLLFDIMEFGIVGGYLSKLCVTLPHMSIGARVVRAVALQEIDNAPHAQTSAESHNKGLQSINSGRKELHIASISPGFPRP